MLGNELMAYSWEISLMGGRKLADIVDLLSTAAFKLVLQQSGRPNVFACVCVKERPLQRLV